MAAAIRSGWKSSRIEVMRAWDAVLTTSFLLTVLSRVTEGRRLAPEEAVYKYCGYNGFWQIRTLLIVALVKVPSAWQFSSTLFTATQSMAIRCPPAMNVDAFEVDARLRKNASVWRSDRVSDKHNFFCSLYFVNYSRIMSEGRVSSFFVDVSREFCQAYDFESIDGLGMKWDLICGKSLLTNIPLPMHLSGVVIGSGTAPYLIQKYGPRAILLSSTMTQVFIGLLTTYIPYFELKLIKKFIIAFVCTNMFIAGYAICTDLVYSNLKIVFACYYEMFWSFGIITASLWFYLFQDWVNLQLALVIPTIFIVLCTRWIPNSPKWLLRKGMYAEAQALLSKGARLNGRAVPNIKLDRNTVASAEKPATLREFFERVQCLKGVTLYLVSAGSYLCFYGTLINVKSLGKHLIFNALMAGVSEIVGILIIMRVMIRSKRKWFVLGMFNFFAGACGCLTWVIPSKGVDPDLREWLIVLLAMTGKVVSTMSVLVIIVSSPKVFESRFQALTYSTSLTFGKFFIMFSPYVASTAMYGRRVSLSFFGGIFIACGVFSVALSRAVEKGP